MRVAITGGTGFVGRHLPVFATVGFRERNVRPIPVQDAVNVLIAALQGRIPEPTVGVLGAEELSLGEAIRRIARVADRRPVFFPLPVWSIRVVAQLSEWIMVTPLVAKAQARMLAEGVTAAAPPTPDLPAELRPTLPFSEARIQEAMPEGRFTRADLRLARK